MSKTVVSFVAISLLSVAGFATLNSVPAWESVDLQTEKIAGGVCYLYTEIKQCEQGGGSECMEILCNWHDTNQRWTCPVLQDWLGYPIYQKIRRAEYWHPGVATSEFGARSYSNQTTHCTETQQCEGCEYSFEKKGFYCRMRKTSNTNTHEGVKLMGGSCP